MSKFVIERYMLRALEESKKSLKIFLNNSSENFDDDNFKYLLFKCLTETIHWLMDCIERIESSKISKDDGKLFSAFKFLNNVLKHNNSLAYINIKKGYITFPISSSIPNVYEYEWADLSYLEDVSEAQKSQRKRYNECLEGKKILNTIEEVIDKVKSYN